MIRDDGLRPTTGYLQRWRYNALDCDLTREVAEVLLPRLEAEPTLDRYYNFSMHQQAPAFAMMMRGVRVNEAARDEAEKAHTKIEADAVAKLNELAPDAAKPTTPNPQKCTSKGGAHSWKGGDICVRCEVPRVVLGTLNPHSWIHVQRLFYDVMGLPAERRHSDHKVSTDDECLGRLAGKFTMAAPLVREILAARKARKQIGLLKAPLDMDGRWRSSFNVGTAVTGRWSSSDSPRRTGGNLQNIADRSRGIFVPDPGLVMFYADYEKAESNIVAYDAEDEAYIAAHLAGDVHTYVASQVWPEAREWTGDLKLDRKLADLPAPWDEHHELRWYGKHIAHGVAIGMTEYGIARDARIKRKDAKRALEAFQAKFPRIFARHEEIWRDVFETRTVTSPLGRRRIFRGRIYGMDAASTRREALAQIQQSMIVDWVSIALCRVWEELDGGASTPKPSDPSRVWLLAQVHDAMLGLVRPGDDEALKEVVRLMSFKLDLHGRDLCIPVEIKIGKSWRHDDLVTWQEGMQWPI